MPLPRAVVVRIGRSFSLWISLREFITDVRRARDLPDSVRLVGNAWERE